jgi:hypothetical protein
VRILKMMFYGVSGSIDILLDGIGSRSHLGRGYRLVGSRFALGRRL